MKSAIDKIKATWFSANDQLRREKTSDLLKIYHHDWKDFVKDKINERFSELQAEKLRLQIDTSTNLLNWVTDELAKIYSRPVARTVEGRKEGLEPYENKGLLNHCLDSACRYTFVCRELAIRPLITDQGSVVLDLITPDKFTVIPDPIDPLGIQAILIELPRSKKARFAYWSNDYHYLLDKSFEPLFQEKNPDNLNPFETIPYLVTHAKFPAMGFFHPEENDALKDATINTGVKLTDHGHLRHFQSFKQVVVTGSVDEKLGRLSFDPSVVARIKSPNANVQTLDMQANLSEHISSLFLGLRPFLATHGIWQDITQESSSSTSGYALSIKQHKQQSIWSSFRVLWTLYEHRLKDLASRCLEVKGFSPLPVGEFEVNFPEVGPEANPQDKADLAKKLKEVGWSRASINREVFDKSEEWIQRNEQELKQEDLADSPLDFPTLPETPPMLFDDMEEEQLLEEEEQLQ